MTCSSGACKGRCAPPKPPRESCCTVRDIDRTAIMVCMTCPHARASGFHACTISGMPIAKHACDRSGILSVAALRRPGGCPLGMTPDVRGRVRWLDETWLGVPWPRRLLLAWPLRLWWGTPRLKRALEGCGCQRELRVVWEATRRRWRRIFARPSPAGPRA